jgi:hypothetical protein
MSDALLHEHLELYKAQTEAWRKEHAGAMLCRQIEDGVALGLFLFDRLCRRDEALQERVFAGEVGEEEAGPLRGQLEAELTLLREVGLIAVDVIGLVEAGGYTVERADEYRRMVREVAGMLTPDAEFFRHDKLVELRDQALEAHRRGETAEMKELGD